MKFMVSTKGLASILDQIPAGEHVERVNMEFGCLVIISQTQRFKTGAVEIMQFEASVEQTDRRWDWVHQLMKQVNEQPVIMEVHKGIINILFQY